MIDCTVAERELAIALGLQPHERRRLGDRWSPSRRLGTVDQDERAHDPGKVADHRLEDLRLLLALGASLSRGDSQISGRGQLIADLARAGAGPARAWRSPPRPARAGPTGRQPSAGRRPGRGPAHDRGPGRSWPGPPSRTAGRSPGRSFPRSSGPCSPGRRRAEDHDDRRGQRPADRRMPRGPRDCRARSIQERTWSQGPSGRQPGEAPHQPSSGRLRSFRAPGTRPVQVAEARLSARSRRQARAAREGSVSDRRGA